MTIDMTKFAGRKKVGRDYSAALRDILPKIIGPRCKPKSKQEIADIAGRDHQTVATLFVKIRAELYIAGWRRSDVGPMTPLWKLGNKPDAPKPPAYTSAEKSRRYRSDPEKLARSKKAQKAWRNSEAGKDWRHYYPKRRQARKAYEAGGVAAIDPLLAAIMGGR